jgi:peptide/nickel transport system substrate-binding protein
MKMTKRIWLTFAVVALVALILIGRSVLSKNEYTLVVGISEEHGNLDPLFGGSPRTTEIVSAIYEQPVTFTIQEKDGHWVQTVDDINGWEPLLAEKVEISADGRTYTFYLRKGVRFYPSGNEMTAADWYWSWQRQLSDPPIGWGQFENKEASITSIESIKVIDDYTVQITTDEVNPRALPFMRLQMFSILDSAEVKQHATPDDPWATGWLAQNTAGTGPYYISSRTPGNELVLAANPYYWGEKPAYQKIVFKTIKETSTRLALITKGDIDVATDIPTRLVEKLPTNSGVKVWSVPSGNRVYLAFNMMYTPYNNLALRQAIAYAIPYDAIIKSIYNGAAQRYDSFVLPEIPGYSGAGFIYEQDLDKAKQLLKDSGIDLQKPLTLHINGSSYEHEQIAVLVQDYLSRIGLKLDVVKLPAADYTTKVFAKELPFFIHEGISWIDDASTIVGLWMVTNAQGNFTKFSNARVDQLQQQWQFKAPSPERNAAYAEAQRIYNEQLNAIYLALTNHVLITRKDIDGYVLYKDTGIRYKDLFPAKK